MSIRDAARWGARPLIVAALVVIATTACTANDITTTEPDESAARQPDGSDQQSGDDGAPSAEGDPAEATAEDTAGPDEAPAGTLGDPETAACSLLTDAQAGELLGLPLEGERFPRYEPLVAQSSCAWVGVDPAGGMFGPSIDIAVTRTEWLDPDLVDINSEAGSRMYWDGMLESRSPDAPAAPDGLGAEAFFSDFGLCVLENDDFFWCVAATAGGVSADLTKADTMVRMAEIVDAQIG